MERNKQKQPIVVAKADSLRDLSCFLFLETFLISLYFIDCIRYTYDENTIRKMKRGIQLSKITDQFEMILKEKQIPLAKKVMDNGQTLYNGKFQITKQQALPFRIVFDTGEGIIDYQIVYHQLAFASDFNKKAAVLEVLNELNELRSGYYRLCLGGDGEIYMRLLSRTSADVQPLYEMLVTGSTIAKAVIPHIEAVINPTKSE